MQTLSYTSARAGLARTMKRVCQDHDPVIITRQKADPVVMLSLEDYESMCETNYLLQSPRNAERLLSSVKELDAGKGTEKGLLE